MSDQTIYRQRVFDSAPILRDSRAEAGERFVLELGHEPVQIVEGDKPGSWFVRRADGMDYLKLERRQRYALRRTAGGSQVLFETGALGGVGEGIAKETARENVEDRRKASKKIP